MRVKSIVLLLATSLCGQAAAQVSCGDCDLNGFATDILDALAGARIAVAIVAPVGEQPCACDVNDDGVIDVLDILLMAQASAGLPIVLQCPAPTCGVAFNTAPEVIINVPTAGATVAGDVQLDFDAIDVDGDPLDVTIELSTNGGASFLIPTQAPGGSVLSNPTGPLPPAVGQTYFWDSVADAIGTLGPFIVVLRVTADDGMATGDALVIVTVNNLLACAGTLTCGTGFNLGFGMGSGVFPPPTFDFAVDSIPVEIDTSGRLPGEAVDIILTTLSDDHDLWIGLPGTPCGDPNPGNYFLASIGGGSVGLGDELQVFGNAELIARGETVNVVVHHFDPNPMSTADLVTLCRPVEVCGGTIACGDPPLVGTTGTLGFAGLPASGLFTAGPMGDSFFFTIDHTGMPAGSGMEVSILNQTGSQMAGLLQFPGVPCGYPDTYAWTGIESIFPSATEDYFIFTPQDLAAFPSGELPLLMYNLAAAMPGGFDVSLRCPVLGPCEGTLTCGSSMVAGQIDMGTSYMFIGNQHTLGPGGDSESWTLDLSGRMPGEDVTVTLRSLTSDCDLFLIPIGIDCGWPLPWSNGASTNPGVGVDDTLLLTDAALNGFGTDQLALMIYRPDPAGGGNYDLSVTCAPSMAGCAGTVEGTIDEALTPLPLQVMGDTFGADDTSLITCGIGGSTGGADHVYEFIPSMTRTYSFDLCTSLYDTSLEIREGNCVSGTTVACDDDTCQPAGPGYQSIVTGVPLTAGTTYYVVVDGWMGTTGTYTLDITTP